MSETRNKDHEPTAGEADGASDDQKARHPSIPRELSTWMERYADGDPEAFRKMHDYLRPRLVARMRRRVGGMDQNLVEDLVQATFLRIHRHRASFRTGAPVLPWVWTIADRLATDALRRGGRRAEDPAGEKIDDVPGRPQDSPSRQLERKELAGQVREAVDELTAAQREVVIQQRFEGRSFDDIAERMGIAAGAARVRSSRGHAKLRTILGPLLGLDPEVPRPKKRSGT